MLFYLRDIKNWQKVCLVQHTSQKYFSIPTPQILPIIDPFL